MDISDAPSLRESPTRCVPQIGDWIVIRGGFCFDVEGPVSAVTARQTRYQWHNRERRIDSSSVLFAGAEKACRDLYSILVASRRQRTADDHAAYERHEARVAKAVVHASARKDGSSPKSNAST